ncbi:MAG: TlyA family RNA methyltransferase [Mycetocola sp.]
MTRLDTAITERGLARSRTRAAELIKAGNVDVNGRVTRKSSEPVAESDVITVAGAGADVSRAAGKLRAVLDAVEVPIAGAVVLDAGASTGGFTQVALERGARTVVAVDVGHGQLVSTIADDPRVISVEGFNVKDLSPESYRSVAGETPLPTVLVADLSFISLTHVIEACARTMSPTGDSRIVLLIKPQFEVGKGNVSRGIATDPEQVHAAIGRVLSCARENGWGPVALVPSPVVGTHGNQEYLTVLTRMTGQDQSQWTTTIDELMTGVR